MTATIVEVDFAARRTARPVARALPKVPAGTALECSRMRWLEDLATWPKEYDQQAADIESRIYWMVEPDTVSVEVCPPDELDADYARINLLERRAGEPTASDLRRLAAMRSCLGHPAGAGPEPCRFCAKSRERLALELWAWGRPAEWYFEREKAYVERRRQAKERALAGLFERLPEATTQGARRRTQSHIRSRVVEIERFRRRSWTLYWWAKEDPTAWALGAWPDFVRGMVER